MDIFDILIWVQILLAPVVFLSLMFVTAPYGRHVNKHWGFQIDTRLGWILMEIPAVLTILIIYVINYDKIHLSNIIFIILWQIHYLYRTFYFPFQLKNRKRSFPLAVILFAIIFNIMNGYINGEFLFSIKPQEGFSYIFTSRFILGLTLFVIGFILHVVSDRIIINLRQKTGPEYSIPRGFMFKYITSPNYLGEWIQWTGWAILTWSIAGFAFALFTFCNLFPRAISNHKWYQNKFPDYPKSRNPFFPKLL